MNYKQQIGANIKQARLASKLSQQQFADALNLSRSSIANIEAGKQSPTLETIARIASLTKYNMYSILDDKSSLPPPPKLPHEKVNPKLIKRLSIMSQEQQSALCNLIDAWIKK